MNTASTVTDTAVARLDALGAEPTLFVQNPMPGASVLSEHIYAAPKAGDGFYWWPWVEPIAADTAEAAAIIRVVRAAVCHD